MPAGSSGGAEDGGMLVLLDEAAERSGGARLFRSPVRIVSCAHPEAVPEALAAIDAGLREGLCAAGFFAYELGYVLEPRLAPLLPEHRDVPLLCVGLFPAGLAMDAADAREWLQQRAQGGYRLCEQRLSISEAQYRDAFARVHAYIAAGDVYQVNLTFKHLFAFAGDPLGLYRDLRRRQPVGCGGYLALPGTPGLHVLSLSPELFLEIAGGRARVRPMKGTAGRGATPEADRAIQEWLAHDTKSRAENLMIVDLMRNDLGRLAHPGSVRVTDLFRVETLRTLHQMTSGIEATLPPGLDLQTLLRALFPCGSVTGAPKIRAMQVIAELEAQPRGIYCGAIGWLEPGGTARFNVAIRTLVLHGCGRGELGIGSGVVHDSDPAAEFAECLLKARFLTDTGEPPFGLIETLRWDAAGGYRLLDRHLARLQASAAFFAIPYDDGAVREALAQAALRCETATRVRLVLGDDAEVSVTSAPLQEIPTPLRFALSPHAVSSADPHRYHKTTCRALLDTERTRVRGIGCDEVLFVNERGELTEGSWTTLFVRRNGRLLTPPLRCGLLDGTLRRELLETGSATEAVLLPEDLETADAVLLGNSVRGLMPACRCAISEGGVIAAASSPRAYRDPDADG